MTQEAAVAPQISVWEIAVLGHGRAFSFVPGVVPWVEERCAEYGPGVSLSASFQLSSTCNTNGGVGDATCAPINMSAWPLDWLRSSDD